MKNQEAYTNAKKKVEARMGFYTHLAVYLLIISMLTILNLTVHGLSTFVFDSRFSMKERLIEKEIQKGNVQNI